MSIGWGMCDSGPLLLSVAWYIHSTGFLNLSSAKLTSLSSWINSWVSLGSIPVVRILLHIWWIVGKQYWNIALEIAVFDMLIGCFFIDLTFLVFITDIVTYFRGIYIFSLFFGFYLITHILFLFFMLMWWWIVVIWVYYCNCQLGIIIILGVIIIIIVVISIYIGYFIISIIIVYGLARFIMLFANYLNTVPPSKSDSDFCHATAIQGMDAINKFVMHGKFVIETTMDSYPGI